jgi:hypothetical protein
MPFDATRFYTPESRMINNPNAYEAFVRGISSGQADYLSRMDSFYKQLEEDARQFDVGLGEEARQFDTNLKEESRQFDTGLSEEKRQFDTTTREERYMWGEEFKEGQKQFSRELGLKHDMLNEQAHEFEKKLRFDENARIDEFKWREVLRKYGSYDGSMNVQESQNRQSMLNTGASLALMLAML